jgi:hypothetical protein
MVFSESAFANMGNEQALTTLTNQMGKVLGIGLYTDGDCWDTFNACADNNNVYKCNAAQTQFTALGFSGSLLVSNDGGAGSACGSWEEDLFDGVMWSEVMTPFYDASQAQLLTVITVGAIEDLGGYQVSYAGADQIPISFMAEPTDFTVKKSNVTILVEGRVEHLFPVDTQNHVKDKTKRWPSTALLTIFISGASIGAVYLVFVLLESG